MMQSTTRISWRNLTASPAIEELIERRIEALERFDPHIVSCNVVVEAPQKRQASARGFQVRVDLQVPGPNISVSRSVRQGHAADDLRIAVNTAFEAVERRLKEHKRKLVGQEVKHHSPILHGEIVELEPELGYGFLRADDGLEVYFQRDGLVNGNWKGLRLGDRLRFREIDGEKGPFAVDVACVGQ
jgi:ribosomal subunit interface protein